MLGDFGPSTAKTKCVFCSVGKKTGTGKGTLAGNAEQPPGWAWPCWTRRCGAAPNRSGDVFPSCWWRIKDLQEWNAKFKSYFYSFITAWNSQRTEQLLALDFTSPWVGSLARRMLCPSKIHSFDSSERKSCVGKSTLDLRVTWLFCKSHKGVSTPVLSAIDN